MKPSLFTMEPVSLLHNKVLDKKITLGLKALIFALKDLIAQGRAIPLQFHDKTFMDHLVTVRALPP